MTEAVVEHLLPVLDQVDHGLGLGPGVGTHSGLGAVGADAERHDGDIHQFGVLVEHAAQGVVEEVAVVQAGTHHDLAVHLDPVIEQRSEPAQAGGAAAIAQHVGAGIGIGGVNRHEER